MATSKQLAGRLHVENVGGIDETTVNFEPGVTVLAGRNATNRSSLLRSIMAAIGSDRVSLKADADAGRVELEFDDDTYARTFERRNGTVVTDGDPYLTDPDQVELANLFAFLLESNEARRAVARGDDLRELLMRPVDTESIRARIEETTHKRDRIDEQLEELDRLADELPGLEEDRQSLESEIEAVESEFAETRQALEAAETEAESGEGDSERAEVMRELESARTEYNRVRDRLETERESVTSLEDEFEELREQREDVPDPGEIEDIEDRLERLREHQSRLDETVSQLQSVVEFNEDLLEGAGDRVMTVLESTDSATTDELLPEDEQELTCWTCGSTAEHSEIESAIERLRSVREDTLAERSEVRAEIDELTSKRAARQERREELERLERRIERTESELADRREQIEELEAERDEFSERVEELEERVADLQEEDTNDEVLDLNRTLNDLEFRRDSLEDDLANVESEIEGIEARLEEREDLEADRESAAEELRKLRDRIDRIEADAVEQFNEHMNEALEILEYENLERIWIDRRTDTEPSRFELNIVRSASDGAVYEDSIDHLSESEREVTGLVFALAGYLVHDVHETVPVMLLDSIEAIDSDRIARLLEYFSGYSDAIVVALLPADAEAVDDDYTYVRDI